MSATAARHGDAETIVVNGRERPLGGAETVALLLQDLDIETGARGVAVAVGGEVVPRALWATRTLAAGDRVELVRAVQGG